MGARSKIEELPSDVRRWLEQALIDNNFSGYKELERLLREKGYFISRSSIHRRGQQMERRMAAIRDSTTAARMITEGAADDQDARSEALIALVQTEMFSTIVNLQEATEEDDPQKRVALLADASHAIANVARASINQKKFRHDLQARAAQVAEKAAKLATKGGLSDDSVAEIRRSILGIAA